MIKRFFHALSVFKYAWDNYHPGRLSEDTFSGWMLADRSFKVGDFDYVKSNRPNSGKVFGPMPNGIEPFMLKKRCINENGDVRFFEVVPKGWSQVTVD